MTKSNAGSVMKELSPSQEKEREEVQGIVRFILTTLTFSFACGIILTVTSLKLIKLMIGINSFGFKFWTWLSIHFVIFGIGMIVSVAVVFLSIVLLARFCKAT